MAITQKTTGVTNAPSALSAAVASRRTNLLSIHVLNTSLVDVVLDLQDGSGGTVIQSIACPANGQAWQQWNGIGRVGRLQPTAGNALYGATRAAASGVEVTLEYGRR